MDHLYYHLGQTLKTIRMNKGYTQEEISDGKMSRSNYTKVENDEINPNIVKFFAILDHMDMSEAEFYYILNGYELIDKDYVIYKFKMMGHDPSLSYIEELITLAEELLDKREDHYVRDVLNIAQGYWALLNDHDIDKAYMHAKKVWDRLKDLDKFYIAEYHLLNKILYFFEVETAISMTNKALEDLKNYRTFQEADKLRLSFLSNIACILIDNNQHKSALVYVEHLIKKSKKEQDILALGAALVRKGMCLEAEGSLSESEVSFNKAIEIFTLLDHEDYIVKAQENPKAVYNPFGFVDLKKIVID
ncbi:helix-turn-helix domain-containing protein [Alkalibacterium kapii]|uniref:HTH cro/C1-type domain-containing protein n=1 Tax=Alkalibacterium kapii TaxID=426704 RepID=A0A511B2A8_9LACT|nr:helix-turn-helix transcriptional regulator [Alkalibacterium kapii]GEK91947.1 hypothetical protein AKA01nite_15690 [Alkalibacterium kapii]